MGTSSMSLPPGFKLEEQNLPEGFQLEESVLDPNKTEGLFGTKYGEHSKAVKFLRDAAATSKQGLRSITNLIPDAKTRSVPLNIILNTPKTVAEIGSDLSADVLQPESILTAGALEGANVVSPVARVAGSKIAEGAEGISGLKTRQPGALSKLTERPSLFVGPGTESAGEAYDALVNRNLVRDSMKGAQGFKDVVGTAEAALKDGSLTTDEAFVARKALDRIRNTIPKDNYFELRDAFDNIAKQKFAGADQAFKDALVSEAVREPLPLNKNGTPSKFLAGMGGLGIGTALKTGNPVYAALGAAASPMVQGATAAGVGLARQALRPLMKNSIASGLGLSELINRIQNRDKK